MYLRVVQKALFFVLSSPPPGCAVVLADIDVAIANGSLCFSTIPPSLMWKTASRRGVRWLCIRPRATLICLLKVGLSTPFPTTASVDGKVSRGTGGLCVAAAVAMITAFERVVRAERCRQTKRAAVEIRSGNRGKGLRICLCKGWSMRPVRGRLEREGERARRLREGVSYWMGDGRQACGEITRDANRNMRMYILFFFRRQHTQAPGRIISRYHDTYTYHAH